MKLLKRIIALALAAALPMTLLGCSAISPTTDDGKKIYKIVYAGTVPDSNAISQAFYWMADELEKRSDGQMVMYLYTNNSLGDSRSNIESMQTASVQIGEVSTGPLSIFTDNYQPISLPFFFTSYQNAYHFTETDLMKELADETAEQIGVRPVGWMLNGARCLTNNKHPVRTPADMKGLKIRVMENEIYLRMFEALGASPTSMSFAEVFTALQQGTVNGQDNPTGLTASNKFYEVQSYFTDLHHVIDLAPVLVSEEWYQSLPDDLRQIFDEVVADTVDYERQLMEESSEEDMKAISSTCEVTTLTDDERQAFKEACQPVYDWFETQYPNLDLQAYMDAAASAE